MRTHAKNLFWEWIYFRSFAEIVEWKNKFLLVSKTFVVKRFSRNAAFREMERECAYRLIKMDYPFEVGCFSGLNLKDGDWNEGLGVFQPWAQWKLESLRLCPRLL